MIAFGPVPPRSLGESMGTNNISAQEPQLLVRVLSTWEDYESLDRTF